MPEKPLNIDKLADILKLTLVAANRMSDFGITMEEVEEVVSTLSTPDISIVLNSLSQVELDLCDRLAVLYPSTFADVVLAFKHLGSFDRLIRALNLASRQNCTVLRAAHSLTITDKACTCAFCGRIVSVSPVAGRCSVCLHQVIAPLQPNKQPEFRMIR